MKTDTSKIQIIERKHLHFATTNTLYSEYFFYKNELKHNQGLTIVGGGYEKCAPDYEINRNNFPYYLIKYLIKGKGTLKIHSQLHHLKGSMISGCAPRIAHIYKCDPVDPMEQIFVFFVGDEAKSLFEKSMISYMGVLDVLSHTEVFFLMDSILKAGLCKPAYSQELCCSYLRTLLLKLASDASWHGQNFSLSVSSYRRCRKYIDDNFPTLRLPRQAAAACGLDVRYMSRLFKRYDNITSQEYIMRLKLNKAVDLLLTSDLTISEIGYSLSFNDQFHFSRNFKKLHGISPYKYRKMHG